MDSSSETSWKPVSNRAKKKSKQGCKTCKRRKVKCDEQRPVCGNCNIYYSFKLQRCDYDHPDPRSSLRSLKSQSSSFFGLPDKHMTRPNSVSMTISQRGPLSLSTLGGPVLDPFNTTAKSRLPNADQLMHHYLSVICQKCLPKGHSPDQNPLTGGLWRLIRGDIFLNNVILQFSAIHLEFLQGRPNTFHSEKYTKESIRILRSRIESTPESTSNETMSAVATLASLEYAKKNVLVMKMHVDGLKRMVKLRGGLSKIRESSQTTATMIHWFTMVVMEGSVFPPDEHDDLTIDVPTRFYSVDPPPQYLDLDSFNIEDTLQAILDRARRIAEHFASGVQGVVDTPDDFHWQFNAVLQRLCHLKVQSPPESSRALFTDACRYGTALFLFLPFDNHFPDPQLLINGMLHKLKSALKNLVPSFGTQSQLLLWLLAVGGVTSLDSPERDWFVGHLIPLISHLDLKSFDDFTSALEGVVYVRKFLDGTFRDLWDDVKCATEILAEHDPYTSIMFSSRNSSMMPVSGRERDYCTD